MDDFFIERTCTSYSNINLCEDAILPIKNINFAWDKTTIYLDEASAISLGKRRYAPSGYLFYAKRVYECFFWYKRKCNLNIEEVLGSYYFAMFIEGAKPINEGDIKEINGKKYLPDWIWFELLLANGFSENCLVELYDYIARHFYTWQDAAKLLVNESKSNRGRRSRRKYPNKIKKYPKELGESEWMNAQSRFHKKHPNLL